MPKNTQIVMDQELPTKTDKAGTEVDQQNMERLGKKQELVTSSRFIEPSRRG